MVFSAYPPPVHLLGDMGMEAELTTEESGRVRTRVTPFVTTPDGGVRVGRARHPGRHRRRGDRGPRAPAGLVGDGRSGDPAHRAGARPLGRGPGHARPAREDHAGHRGAGGVRRRRRSRGGGRRGAGRPGGLGVHDLRRAARPEPRLVGADGGRPAGAVVVRRRHPRRARPRRPAGRGARRTGRAGVGGHPALPPQLVRRASRAAPSGCSPRRRRPRPWGRRPAGTPRRWW